MKKCMYKIENMPLQPACQKLGNGPGVVKCPAPEQCKICKCPTPGTDKTGKCPCNALLYGLPWSVLDRLQYVQNCATHVVSRTQSSEHTCKTPVLRQLPWLPIKQWIAYKILLLMYNAMNGMAPKYIVDLLDCYNPTRQLRSSSNNPILLQKSNLKSYGDGSFQVAAPRLWNALPNSIRLIQSLNVFENKLKTFSFEEAFY